MTRIILLRRNSYEIFTGTVSSLDLSSYSDPDFISVACPDMSDDIDLENSFIEFTSSRNGEFTGSIASLKFSETLNELDLPGDTELQFPISAISSIDVSNVTAVRFRITASDDLVFKVMAIRAISKDWTYAPLDINTISKCLEIPVSPDGSPDYPTEFPVESDGLEFNNWPIVWQDIYPKNFSASFEISTGSLQANNSFSIFFRGGNLNKGIINDLEDWQNQGPITMETLNGMALEMDISEDDSSSLEYLGSKLTWSPTESFLEVFSNPDDEGDRAVYYLFENIPLEPQSRYMVTFINNMNSFRAKIHEIDLEIGVIEKEVFDSGLMRGYLFNPRPGFFGWWSELNDGDGFVDNVRHRHANFGDLKTRQFQSITPVSGLQLHQTASTPKSLIDSFGAGPWGGLVSADSFEADGYRIVSMGKMEGIQTNEFLISDWENTDIEFELNAADGDYICYLLGANQNIIELDISQTAPTEWKTFRYQFDGRVDSTGPYRLVILKRDSETQTAWRVRNVMARTKLISWSARNQDDPWDMAPEEWIHFGETTNKNNSGLMFKEPGYVQVKASLHNNEAEISEFHIMPKYAELGRLVFEDKTLDELKHNLKISTEVNGLSVKFFANVELSGTDSRVPISYVWIINSLNDWYSGPYANVTFKRPGDHQAVLQVTYDDGSVQTAFWKSFLSP